MQNTRELISRRIAILTEQAAGARQAGTRVDLIEGQIEGWNHVLAMFDAGTRATTPRFLKITDADMHRAATSDEIRLSFAPVGAMEAWVRRKLVAAGFDVRLPFTITRTPENATEYHQEPMLPCAS